VPEVPRETVNGQNNACCTDEIQGDYGSFSAKGKKQGINEMDDPGKIELGETGIDPEDSIFQKQFR
jgi:hypothetical protein